MMSPRRSAIPARFLWPVLFVAFVAFGCGGEGTEVQEQPSGAEPAVNAP